MKNHPSLSEIGARQNHQQDLRYRLAAAHFYRWAKWLRLGGGSISIALALAAAAVLLFRPSLGPYLGAIAGLWIFISRLLLERWKREYQYKGATAQEHFDCEVLGIDWNNSLVRRLPHEDISAASRSMEGEEDARNWYATEEKMQWPQSVLFCQRSNAVWARRQHRSYANTVVAVAVAWAVFGVVLAAWHGTRLDDYLVIVALPSLPAFLDASELAAGHISASRSRELLEEQTDELLRNDHVSDEDIRLVQDQLFVLRSDAPLVPGWFYKRLRPKFEQDMRYAAQQVAAASKNTGKSSGGKE